MILEAVGGFKDSNNAINWIFRKVVPLREELIGRWRGWSQENW